MYFYYVLHITLLVLAQLLAAPNRESASLEWSRSGTLIDGDHSHKWGHFRCGR